MPSVSRFTAKTLWSPVKLNVENASVACGEDIVGTIKTNGADVQGVRLALRGELVQPKRVDKFLDIERAVPLKDGLNGVHRFQFTIPEAFLPPSAQIMPVMVVRYTLTLTADVAARQPLKQTVPIRVLGLCRPAGAVPNFKTSTSYIYIPEGHSVLFMHVSRPYGNWLSPGSIFDLDLRINSRDGRPWPHHTVVSRVRVIVQQRYTYTDNKNRRQTYTRDVTSRVEETPIDLSGETERDLSECTRQIEVPQKFSATSSSSALECVHSLFVSILVHSGYDQIFCTARPRIVLMGDKPPPALAAEPITPPDTPGPREVPVVDHSVLDTPDYDGPKPSVSPPPY